MTKISWKPGTMLFPLPPVMVTSGTMEKPNVCTVAWTGIVNSEPPLTYVSIRPSRYSHELIKASGEFVINITTLELATACDYCGVKSGRDTDKFKDMNLEIEPCSKVSTPMLTKSPISLECRVKSVASYETHDMFLAEIVNVNIDDKYLEEDGRLALEKAGLLAFVHGRYYTLGRDLGAFGFSVDKSKENKTKPRKSKFAELIEQEKEVDSKEIKLERPPFNKNRSREGYHSERRDDNRTGSGERSYRPRTEGGDRRSSGSGERSYRPRTEGGERSSGSGERTYRPRTEGGDRRSSGSGERSYRPRTEGGDRRSSGSGERSYRPRTEGGDNRSSGSGERSYRPRTEGGERSSGSGERSYRPRTEGGERSSGSGERTYRPRTEGGDRRSSGSGERKFDGKSKFAKARRDDDHDASSSKSDAPRKHYGATKTFTKARPTNRSSDK